MRRLLPPPTTELDGDDLYAELALDGPWTAIGMVASLDGAAVDAEGTSGGLGGVGDLAAFRALRAACDVVVVGAGTARTERYGPARLTVAQQERRAARGQAPQPVIAVVSRSLDLDGAEGLFGDDRAPLVVTTDDADPDRVAALEARGSEVLRAGADDVVPRRLVTALHERGLTRVLCEGGPGMNGAMLGGGVVDRMFVTVAPRLVGGDAGRIVRGPRVDLALRLDGVREHDGDLLLAYRVAGA